MTNGDDNAKGINTVFDKLVSVIGSTHKLYCYGSTFLSKL